MVWEISIFSEWFYPGRCVWSSFSIGPTPRRHPRPHAFHHTPPHPRTTPRSCRWKSSPACKSLAGDEQNPQQNTLQATFRNAQRANLPQFKHQQTFQEQIPGQHSRGQDQGCLPMVSPMDPTYGHGPPSRGGDSRIFLWEYRTDIDYQHVTTC